MRSSTATAHARLDAAVGDFDDRNSYLTYLRCLQAFREPLEMALDRSALPAEFAGWLPIRLAPAIASDREDLEGTVSPFLAGRALAAPEPRSPSHAVGMVYVLEGASLGAQVLARRARDLGFDETHGASHLGGRKDSLTNWREFLVRLEAVEGLDMEAAEAGAQETFLTATEAFTGSTYVEA
ncbi:biliverdin-producing heme oxygenase [Amorphus orientalis]|uniref:Heme oxygenase n=1 Tax=Amorphus orientalis TaxID=649198 RepID=A0AAE3VPK5_9HYPH|nr:biliverdin-producing heme oxygenase [Amorphus orientalis]MDQ0316479.1 heme oxygenase [Amorphus orientalis]